MGLFDMFKKKEDKGDSKALDLERFPEEPRDDFKSKEYYVGHLQRIDSYLAEIESKVQDNFDSRSNFYTIRDGHLNQRVCLLYVLHADMQEVRDAALRYVLNIRELSQFDGYLTGNMVYRALAFATLFDFALDDISFLQDELVDERYVDASMDLLRNALFKEQATTNKDFYFKDKGYFGDVTTGVDGLMLAIRAKGQKDRTAEFVKFLKNVKEKHYKRLLKHYEEVGDQRYVYTGSYDFRFTAVAKALDIDKETLSDSKFIAVDLM